MKAVVFNPIAISDIDEITSYIASENPKAAAEVRNAVFDLANLLENFPSIGCRPAFSAPRFVGIRFLPLTRYRNYLVFFRETDSEVEILRVLHAARDTGRFFR